MNTNKHSLSSTILTEQLLSTSNREKNTPAKHKEETCITTKSFLDTGVKLWTTTRTVNSTSWLTPQAWPICLHMQLERKERQDTSCENRLWVGHFLKVETNKSLPTLPLFLTACKHILVRPVTDPYKRTLLERNSSIPAEDIMDISSFIHSFIHSAIHSFIHSFIHISSCKHHRPISFVLPTRTIYESLISCLSISHLRQKSARSRS